MTEKEVTEQIESIINDFNIGNDFDLRVNATDVKALQTILQLLEQKDNRIDELEKVLIDEQLKHTDKINKAIDKMIGDKMEQFDDYVIYLIESYLEILEE